MPEKMIDENEESIQKVHFNSLDFIKICATFAIIFHHYQQYLTVNFSHANFFNGAFPFHSMVYLFFMISGFFMTRYINRIIAKKDNFEAFIKKRAFRLLPLTALTAVVYELVLVVFVLLTGTTYNRYTTIGMGLKNVGILNGMGMLVTMTGTGSGWFWRGNLANESTWYICVLLLCYIVFYICCRLADKFSFNVNYAFSVVVMVGLGIASYGIELPFLNSFSYQGYIPFFLGVMLGEFMEKRRNSSRGIVLALGAIGLFTSIIYIVGMFYFTKAAFTDSYWLMLVTFPCLIIVFLADPVKRMFKHKIWRVGGVITFNMYVWHFICIILLCGINNGLELNLPIGSRWFMIAFSAVVFLVGVISYSCVEERVGRFIKMIFGKIKDTEVQ